MHDMDDSFWPTVCAVCKQPFMSDGEPCCSDIVCQAVMSRAIENHIAAEEAQRILDEYFDKAMLVEYGL